MNFRERCIINLKRGMETEKERGEDPNPNPRNPKNEGVCLGNDSRSNVEWIQKVNPWKPRSNDGGREPAR
jgi:hypothetical protein